LIFVGQLLTGTKHPDFSTNIMSSSDIDKTTPTHNYNHNKNLNNLTWKPITCIPTTAN